MNAESSPPYLRGLYHALMEYEGAAVFDDVLAPWLPEARRAVAALDDYREPGEPIGREDDRINDLWGLYAIGRVIDYLLLPFQADAGHVHELPGVTLAEYLAFFEGAGFSSFDEPSFRPIRHEIVEVVEGPPGTIAIEHVFWPGLRLGRMIVSRSGVRVRAGRDVARKEVAERSPLYFTHRRLRRPTFDLSQGWGSNSQWRTKFRRDYETDDGDLFHADGPCPLDAAAPGPVCAKRWASEGLTTAERVELLTHRGFVVTPRGDEEFWPYDDRHFAPRGAS